MEKRLILSFFAIGLLIGTAACRADREAAEQVDPSPNPAIEQAPAHPIPPIGVPPVGTEEAAARIEGDTIPADTLRLDTLPRSPGRP